MKKNPAKVQKVLHEYKAGKLHSGKIGKGKGPLVKSRKQAIAIALSEAGMSKAMNKGVRKGLGMKGE
jgi:hypothetical protein